MPILLPAVGTSISTVAVHTSMRMLAVWLRQRLSGAHGKPQHQ
jgi:hypothetical protein